MRPDAIGTAEQLRATRNQKTTMLHFRRKYFSEGEAELVRRAIHGRAYALTLPEKPAKAPWRVHEVKNKQASSEQ